MLIGLISDTHIPLDVNALPEKLNQAFNTVDLILHAGDIYDTSVLDELSAIAPVLAARGDDDCGKTLEDERVKERHIITVEGVTIWLFHEYRYSAWYRYEKAGKEAWDKPEPPPDVLVYGHFHRVEMERKGPVLKITPGSATLPNYKNIPGTVGLLSIDSGEATAEIIQL